MILSIFKSPELKRNYMRKIHGCWISLMVFIMTAMGCGIGQQTKELKTLADCEYSISKVENITLSGTDVRKLFNREELNLAGIPSLALGFISKNIPLNADLTLSIANPTNNYAAIQYFDYEILINQHLFTEGTVNELIDVGPKETTTVTLPLSTNIYSFLVNDSVRNDIEQFVKSTRNKEQKSAAVTIRIKPAILIGEKLLKYPGFIDIEREIDNRLLLEDTINF